MTRIDRQNTTALTRELAAMARTESQDAELIALCGEFVANECRFIALHDGPDAIIDDDEREPFATAIHDQQIELVGKIAILRATTLPGFAALVCAIGIWGEGFCDPADHNGGVNERLFGMLVRDAPRIG